MNIQTTKTRLTKLFHYMFQKLFGGIINFDVQEISLSLLSRSSFLDLSRISSTFWPPMLLIIRITFIFFLIVFQLFLATLIIYWSSVFYLSTLFSWYYFSRVAIISWLLFVFCWNFFIRWRSLRSYIESRLLNNH